MKYVSGSPNLEESNELWKADPSEPDMEGGEYFAAYESLSEHLELRYPTAGWPPDLYVRGDCFGDKTQYIHFYRPEIINMELLAYLQQWLRTYGSEDWRILVATEIGNAEAVLVYPNKIRTGSQYEGDLPRSLDLFVKRMRDQDAASGRRIMKPLPSEDEQ